MLIEQPYLHAINPFAIQFSSSFGIRWYGLAYIGGFIAGYLTIHWMLKRRSTPFPLQLLADFVFATATGCIIGGRLGYCIFYKPELLIDFRSEAPFWGVIALNEGGMASHGGIIGMILACYLFHRKHKLPFFHLMDLTILGSTLGIFFGRLANFINGELVGRACNGKCILPVQFPYDILSWPSYEAFRLASLEKAYIAATGYGADAFKLVLNSSYSQIDAALNVILSASYGGNITVQNALSEVLTARHPYQLYASFLEGLGIFLVLFFVWRKPQKPGVIAAGFLILYSIGRVVGEFFREPDLHLGFQALGLTRGQWLSVAIFCLGVLLLYLAKKSTSEKLGGWMVQKSSN